MRHMISARSVCALQGSVTEMPLCGKLWARNADDVSQMAAFSNYADA
jgi:hypothetical protein